VDQQTVILTVRSDATCVISSMVRSSTLGSESWPLRCCWPALVPPLAALPARLRPGSPGCTITASAPSSPRCGAPPCAVRHTASKPSAVAQVENRLCSPLLASVAAPVSRRYDGLLLHENGLPNWRWQVQAPPLLASCRKWNFEDERFDQSQTALGRTLHAYSAIAIHSFKVLP